MVNLFSFARNVLLRFLQRAAEFSRASFGGIGITFAISLPALLAIAGVASDYAVMIKLRAELQEVADAAAMAGAREIPLANANADMVESATRTFAIYRLTGDSRLTENDLTAEHITVDVKVADDFSSVDVKIREDWSPFFAHVVSKSVTPIRVSSSARFVGRTNICVLGLKETNTAVLLDKSARLTGNNCGLFTNSTGTSSLKVNSGAELKASIVCSAGGVDQTSASISPPPLTDCPVTEDPLKNRPPPAVGSCDHTNLVLTDVVQTLGPGVYCGGIVIDGSSQVFLVPGTYVLKDGGLIVTSSATMIGDGVGFYLTGNASPIEFGDKTHISLAAPKSGPLAGLLIFEDRNLPVNLKHEITSDDARKLIGTIYLPVGGLVVNAKNPVADQSAYTAIIAQTLDLNFGPNLILNSDYEATDVPVPAGIAGSSRVILSN